MHAFSVVPTNVLFHVFPYAPLCVVVFIGSCGYVFLKPSVYEDMGTDLHDCMRTFQIHPATGLPRRPGHIKSVMRLRPPPTAVGIPDGGTSSGSSRRRREAAEPVRAPPEHEAGERMVGTGSGSFVAGGGDDVGDFSAISAGPCEHSQHLAWLLLSSACLSKVQWCFTNTVTREGNGNMTFLRVVNGLLRNTPRPAKRFLVIYWISVSAVGRALVSSYVFSLGICRPSFPPYLQVSGDYLSAAKHFTLPPCAHGDPPRNANRRRLRIFLIVNATVLAKTTFMQRAVSLVSGRGIVEGCAWRLTNHGVEDPRRYIQ